jgi:formate dehydrogenase iron-sulfur subunit
MSATLELPPIRTPRLKVVGDGGGLVDQLLREQGTMTAVDRFSQRHESLPHQSLYRDLLPLEKPRPGQQYSFEVDLDACTGCKACVAACHSLNGLDEDEVWRTVGLLHGGTPETPAQQTVTTSCHHCVDPACLAGCPVKAYEKDPVTGIVRHLDDQCIGCQYCTLMCPYDAPKYSARRGIVRKCDLCSSRLAADEAPACVQACPNEAIRIRVIDQAQAVQASEAGTFLPGAPAPDHTIPTTVYRSARPAPRNLLPADFYAVSPDHGHPPLVIMLVLTQLAVGTFVMGLLAPRAASLLPAALSLGTAFVALAAAMFHLGRPQYAFRAVLGLRTSWMSREILAFGLFAKAATLHALAMAPIALPLRGLLGGHAWQVATAALGVAGVICSVMIYAATRRAHWAAAPTALKFVGTTVILGAAASAVFVPTPALRAALMVASIAKLAFEAAGLRHLRARQHSVGKRVALLMTRDLRGVTLARFVAGVAGGVVLPALGAAPSVGLRILMLALLLGGELAERSLFFKAAPPSRMPGGLA